VNTIIRFAAISALGLALGMPAVRAQTPAVPHFDLQRLTLDPAARGSLVVGNGEVAPAGEYRFSAALELEHQPLILQGGALTGNGFPTHTPSAAIVNDRVTMLLGVGYTLWQRLEVSARVPVIGYQSAQGLQQAGIASPQTAGLATPTFGLRYGVLAQDEEQDDGMPFSLAVAGEVLTPWGANNAVAGQDSTAFATRLELGRRFGAWLLAAQGGALFRTSNIDMSPEKGLGNELNAGGSIATTGKFRVEVSARVAYDLNNGRKSLEELAGVRYSFGKLEVFALGGPGFGHLAGTPSWFGMFGLAMGARAEKAVHVAAAPPAPAPIVLAAAAPTPAAPPPPVDPCSPSEQHTAAQCPFLDDDNDGIPNGLDACPLIAGIKELAGCPTFDTDGDGIADHLDRCPNVAGVAEYQGCPAPKLARLNGPKIEIVEAIYFKWSGAAVEERSLGLLDDVAAVIKAHPEIRKVRIEGHTDSSGNAAVNRALSRRRAKAVRAYLVEQGIERERLSVAGFGPDRPVATNATAAGRHRNRRVDFFATWSPTWHPPQEVPLASVKPRGE
jgi:OmpA-OmpF porin, OOP family